MTTTNAAALTRAIEYLHAEEIDGEYRFHDEASNTYVRAHASELEQLGQALIDGRPDAYSHWCSETVLGDDEPSQ